MRKPRPENWQHEQATSCHAVRNAAWFAAMRTEDWDRAYWIARLFVPADATDQQRSDWGARRDACRIVGAERKDFYDDYLCLKHLRRNESNSSRGQCPECRRDDGKRTASA